MKTSTRFLGLSLALAACGGAPGNNYNTPVASLSGTITSAAISTPSELHVALVWDHFTDQDGELKSAQEVGVRAQFPVHFQLDIATPPPEEAMNRVPADEATWAGFDPASFRFALGTVLVYEDGNGNGKLDLLSVNAKTFVDRPLGAAKPWIMYIEGTPPPDDAFGAHLVPGFNLVAESPSACPVDGEGHADFCSPSLMVLPLSTGLDIALTSDPRLSELLCQTGGGAHTGSGTAPSTGTSGGGGSGMGGAGVGSDAFVPPPPGATINCSTDKRSFTAELCEQASLCSDTACAATSSRLEPGDAIPAGWPCP